MTSNQIQGVRRDRLDDTIPKSGEYGMFSDKSWYACPPNTELVANLSNHDVIEHADGSVTVSPSILITRYNGNEIKEQWHGYLKSGYWQKI